MTVITPCFPTVKAESVEDYKFAGRNKSVLLSCVDDGGCGVRCVTKFRPLLESAHDAFWCEWVAGLIGDELGVPLPPRYAVEVSPTLAPVIARRAGKPTDAAAFAGLHFGTEYVLHVGVVLDETFALEEHLREQAARIAAFDVFIDNPDRRKENPNCLLVASEGSRLLAIDHDLAFSGLLVHIFGNSWPTDILSKHLFRGRFGTKTPDLADVQASLARLTDAFLDELPAQVPSAWLGGAAQANVAKVIAALKRRRDAIDDWFPEFERWVTT